MPTMLLRVVKALPYSSGVMDENITFKMTLDPGQDYHIVLYQHA